MLYFNSGSIIASSGDVRIYKYMGDVYLEIGPGHFLWARGIEINEYSDQLKNTPRGNCLEVGLGLGIASNYILEQEGVTSLTTIEKNRDVMECYRKLLVYNKNNGDVRHNIVIGDVHNVFSELVRMEYKYDFIFFDHYSLIDEDTISDLSILISIARKLLNPGGVIRGWFDPYTPEEFVEPFNRLFEDK